MLDTDMTLDPRAPQTANTSNRWHSSESEDGDKRAGSSFHLSVIGHVQPEAFSVGFCGVGGAKQPNLAAMPARRSVCKRTLQLEHWISNISKSHCSGSAPSSGSRGVKREFNSASVE